MTLSPEMYSDTYLSNQRDFYYSLKSYSHDDLLEYLLQTNELYIQKRHQLLENFEADSLYIQMRLIQMEIKARMVV